MGKTIKLKIGDDSGFIAIINSERYSSYVDENWEVTQLFNHFVSEMNKDHIIIWATGYENEWTVEFCYEASMKEAFREFTKTIMVTNGELFLTNYEDLTMAAQFKKEKVPAKHNADLSIKLDNGIYHFTVRQMFDPNDYDYEHSGNTNFEIVIKTNVSQTSISEEVFWRTN